MEQPATASGHAERAAIARRSTALLAAVNASDVAGVLGVWSEDGVLMPPHHPSVHGRTDLERYFTHLFQQRRFAFRFTSSHIHVDGDLAVERVEYEVTACPAKGGAEVRDAGKGLHVWRREPGGTWTLAADCWNSDEPVSSGR